MKQLQKVILVAWILLLVSISLPPKAFVYHSFFFRSASDLTSGKLADNLLNYGQAGNPVQNGANTIFSTQIAGGLGISNIQFMSASTPQITVAFSSIALGSPIDTPGGHDLIMYWSSGSPDNPLGSTLTIRTWNVNESTGKSMEFKLHEPLWSSRIYDSVFSTIYAAISTMGVVWSSTMGINGGNAIFFNGTTAITSSGVIQGQFIKDSYVGTSGKMSVAVWIHPLQVPGGNSEILERCNSDKGWYLRIGAARTVTFYTTDGNGSPGATYTSTAVINVAHTNHILCTVDVVKEGGQNVQCWVNGNICSGGSLIPATPGVAAADDLTIGSADSGNRPYKGWFQGMTMWDWALSTAAAQAEFRAGYVRPQ